jgi:hypothetical protein
MGGPAARPREGDPHTMMALAHADPLPRIGRLRLGDRSLLADPLDGPDKSKAATRNGADPVLPPPVITDGRAGCTDTGADRGVGHDPPTPDLGHELVVTDQPVGIPHQQQQDVEHLRFDMDRCAFHFERMAVRAQRAGAETIPHAGRISHTGDLARQNLQS